MSNKKKRGREGVPFGFDGLQHVLHRAVVTRELEDSHQAEHAQHAQVGSREQQLQVKRHRAEEVHQSEGAEDVFLAAFPGAVLGPGMLLAVGPHAQDILDREHDHADQIKYVEVGLVGFMDLVNRLQDDGHHVGHHQHSDENFAGMAGAICHGAIQNFVGPTAQACDRGQRGGAHALRSLLLWYSSRMACTS